MKVERPGTFLANPWIKHYKSSCRRGTTKISPAFQKETPLATDSHLQLDRQDSVDSNAGKWSSQKLFNCKYLLTLRLFWFFLFKYGKKKLKIVVDDWLFAEVTDQNFVDEVSEEDKSSRIRSRKYRKTTKAANSDSDQVWWFILQDMTWKHGIQIPFQTYNYSSKNYLCRSCLLKIYPLLLQVLLRTKNSKD